MENKTKRSKKLTRENILHIANLARIKLSKKEVERFTDQLSVALDYVEILKELDQQTRKFKPTSHVFKLENVFREDEIRPSLSQKETLRNAKRTHKGYFVTKAVFE